jgi:hypothetical protein
MNKFKEADEIVRVSNAQPRVPLGYKTEVLLSYEYIDLHNGLSQIHDEFWELVEDTSKPVYTQGMYDNNELPAVGMYFNCSDEVNYDFRIDDFKGKEVEVIAVSDFFGKKVITFYHSTKGLGCGNFLKSWVHPITPAPIELIDNAPYMFEVGGSKFLGFYETSQEAFFDRDDGGEEVAELSDCTNIRHMTVAESK